ncbi:MAG TPA: WbqC family protein, partial [bacterium]|nr:WbqC family protein [bacterium]
MIAGIHQLHYLPWLRYFHKIAQCDVFVILDDIQYNKNGWQNRNKIKGSGGPLTLTVPVFSKYQQNLNEVKIDNKVSWRKKHWASFEYSYRKAPFFERYAAELADVYQREWEELNAVNFELLTRFLRMLNIRTKIVRSSESQFPGTATERLVTICRQLGAETYLTGEHARDMYLDEAMFAKEGIGLVVQSWKAP